MYLFTQIPKNNISFLVFSFQQRYLYMYIDITVPTYQLMVKLVYFSLYE